MIIKKCNPIKTKEFSRHVRGKVTGKYRSAFGLKKKERKKFNRDPHRVALNPLFQNASVAAA